MTDEILSDEAEPIEDAPIVERWNGDTRIVEQRNEENKEPGSRSTYSEIEIASIIVRNTSK